MKAQKRQTTFWTRGDYYLWNFTSKITLTINAANEIKIKDDVQVVLLLSCFLGHPVNQFSLISRAELRK